MKAIKIGLLGLGTVGGGTVNVLRQNGEEIARRVGRQLQVTHALVKSKDKARICETQGLTLTEDPADIVRNPDIDIVVELMGGTDAAKDCVLQAITNGKHIITANKALIAMEGNNIFQQASEKGLMVAFEAAVAGGIPVIKTIREGLGGNRIEWLAGIINGTSNFILSAMETQGRDFAEALQEAQRLGYAEEDPTFDVEGHDVAHKLTILASIAYGIPLQFDKVHREGIAQITTEDMHYADKLGYRIKHLGIASQRSSGLALRVHPTLIPKHCMMANVNGVMNAVLIQANALGPTLLYGAGAGAQPTASAIVADIVEVARMMTVNPEHQVPHLAFQREALSEETVLPMDDVETSYYLRLNVSDKAGVLGEITKILGELNISIEAILQKDSGEGAQCVPVVILTHRVIEKNMNVAIERMESLADVHENVIRIRMETLDASL